MRVVSVNLAPRTAVSHHTGRPTGIDKVGVAGPVEIREPGSKRDGVGSGLVGDVIGDHRHHGGSDQAVYAYARESLSWWEQRLERELPDGHFGENLTTHGVDVDGALIGERWQIGEVVLQVTAPRIPCATFRAHMGRVGWLKEFVAAARPGAYLRVVTGGMVRAGDQVQLVGRPRHGVSIALVFRALSTERELLPALLDAGPDLPEDIRHLAARAAASRSAPDR